MLSRQLITNSLITKSILFRSFSTANRVAYRPRRSVLYMPGSNQRALEKSKTLNADGYIFDLEDACAPSKKVDARHLVCQKVKEGGFGFRELIIRCNGLDTKWGEEDIREASLSGADAIALPKVESYDTIDEVVNIMDKVGAPKTMGIWSLIETPRGILNAENICSHPRNTVIVMGTSDLSKDLCLENDPSRYNMVYSLQKCIVAAKAYRKCILDGVYLDLSDSEGFEKQCIQGKSFGFDGKTLIHPKTIEACNKVFTPTPEQVDHSRKIIDAFEQANKEGKGVVVVDGKLIENLHIEKAKMILDIHNSISTRN
ncbi:hypothetical protein WA158_006835 [Blastocystis sp. Blastoise]